MAVATLVFLWLGTVADRWLGTRPAFTLVGAFVGAAAGFYHMIHHLIVVPKRRVEAERRKTREADGGEGRP
jgi:F0F1-type ATP synthase assembly protein I